MSPVFYLVIALVCLLMLALCAGGLFPTHK